MGLKVQRSCNLLTTLLKNRNDSRALIFPSEYTWVDLNNRLLKLASSTSFDHVQGSMDRLLEQNSRECVRSTMMRQEEVFKQQVHELHRLYHVQKMLMAELKNEVQIHAHATATTPRAVTDTKNKYWSSTATSETSHSSYISNRHHPVPQLKSEYHSIHRHSMSAEEPSARDKGFDLERPAKCEATISHVSKELWADEECDVELTLSIGCSSRMNKPKNWLHHEPASEKRQFLLSDTGARPERGEECSERESLQRPPWLFQAMSLNRT